MTSPTAIADRRPRAPEWLLIFGVTGLAAAIRFAEFGRLAVDHFDEGIYLRVGVWSLLPGGLRELDPGVIYYAPPLYPLALGLLFFVVGPSDVAGISVSILAGLATIPVVGWLGRKLAGPGGGFIASTVAAVSGIHITFSRMALTDASFLLAWSIGLIAGLAFLERPGLWRAIGLGVATGVALNVKYNGWLVGAIVFLAAAVGVLSRAEERRAGRILRVFGWGSLAAILAILIDVPWVRYVERNGGYSGLLAHQRGYLDPISAWPGNLAIQLRQVIALSTTGWCLLVSGLLISSGLRLLRVPVQMIRGVDPFRRMARLLLLCGLCLPDAGWLIGLALAPLTLTDGSPGRRLIGTSWIVLTILTPLYHPYSRLWLPLELTGWLFLAIAGSWLMEEPGGVISARPFDGNPARFRGRGLTWLAILFGVLASLAIRVVPPGVVRFDDVIGPRDSFREAALRIAAKIPTGSGPVRILARPNLGYYANATFSRRAVPVIQEDAVSYFNGVREGWALIDEAVLKQEGDPDQLLARLLIGWELVATELTRLSPATALDNDPRTATDPAGRRSLRLFLLRPRREASPP